MNKLWNGSISTDLVFSDQPQGAIKAIEKALDAANATEIETPRQDLALLSMMTKVIEGVAGASIIVESFNGYFQDNSEKLDSEEFMEEYGEWRFNRKDYAMKNGSYDEKTFKNARERKIDLDKQIANRTIEILATYNNIYKPYIMFETLLTVPADGGGADYPYGTTFGAINNNAIDKRKLKSYRSTATAGQKGSTIRNNWRAINSNGGVNFDDIKFCKSYMDDIVGIFGQDVIMYGNGEDLGTIQQNAFSDFSPRTEEILVGGIPSGIQADSFNGMKMISVTTPFPDQVVAFINPNADYLVTRLVSEVPEYQGIAIQFPMNQDKFKASAEGFQGAKIVIQEEGYFLTGVLDILFLDIDPTNFDASGDRLMQADGFTKVRTKQKDLKSAWYVSVNKRV